MVYVCRCNWTAPVGTSIPDSHSRACTAPLPDGRVFLVGAQILKGRDPLVLSLSSDGLAFDQVARCGVTIPLSRDTPLCATSCPARSATPLWQSRTLVLHLLDQCACICASTEYLLPSYGSTADLRDVTLTSCPSSSTSLPRRCIGSE